MSPKSFMQLTGPGQQHAVASEALVNIDHHAKNERDEMTLGYALLKKKILFPVAKVEEARVGRSVQNFFWSLKFLPWLTTQYPQD